MAILAMIHGLEAHATPADLVKRNLRDSTLASAERTPVNR